METLTKKSHAEMLYVQMQKRSTIHDNRFSTVSKECDSCILLFLTTGQANPKSTIICFKVNYDKQTVYQMNCYIKTFT